ncbi:MAG: TIGR04076 family protein [Candidatus Schekmanbacteria bacterium]|nr:TIGR04076 family protein [Candidatus Schekmanbacteria bacterium]
MPDKYRLTLTITSISGKCNAGCKVGEKYDISSIKTDNLCGFFYHSLFPTLCTFDYGGEIWFLPDKNRMEVRCPDYINDVRGTLERKLKEE